MGLKTLLRNKMTYITQVWYLKFISRNNFLIPFMKYTGIYTLLYTGILPMVNKAYLDFADNFASPKKFLALNSALYIFKWNIHLVNLIV